MAVLDYLDFDAEAAAGAGELRLTIPLAYVEATTAGT